MEYIHETSQMAKLYLDDVSRRKTTMANAVFEMCPGQNSLHLNHIEAMCHKQTSLAILVFELGRAITLYPCPSLRAC